MSSNGSRPDDQKGLDILDVTLTSTKSLKSVVLKIKTPTAGDSAIYHEKRTDATLPLTFAPPRDTPLAAGSTVRIKYPGPYKIQRSIKIKGADLLIAYKQNGDETQAWKKSYGSTEVVVRLAKHSGELRSTTDDIRKICPRFRILVLGRSGAGKSSLINKAFGVADALVSDEIPGDADIDKEIYSKDNPSFVLHDSRGFEAGETKTLEIVQGFIKRRGANIEIKLKLHAVWVCIEAPTSGGRLLETGVEEFLKSGAGGHLGKVPIIVIFTKFDEIVTGEKMAIMKEKPREANEDASEREAATVKESQERAYTRVEKDCIVPLKTIVGNNIPYVVVSTNNSYRNTLTKLIDVTFEHVTDYIQEAGIISGISQRVNPNVKILTSIEVGKRNYWKGLASKTVPGMTMENFLAFIHSDIVKVWDLDDKHNYLTCPEFKELILRVVQDTETRNPSEAIMLGARILGAVGSIVSFFADPAALIVLPITATIAAAVWIYDANRQTRDNLRRMMIYIVSLTIVMQNLFWIKSILETKPKLGDNSTSGRVPVPITRRLIKLALDLYLRAADREHLLTEIRNYTDNVNFITQRSDATVKKLTDFLQNSAINNEDGFKQQKGLERLNKSWVEEEEDVSWSSSDVDVL